MGCVDTLPSSSFSLCWFWVLRCGGGSEADHCFHPAEGRDRPEATVWRSRRAGLPAAGQPMAWTNSRPLWDLQWESARWLFVRKHWLHLNGCWDVWFCLYWRSPAGMIEGTPQLHANAWKISSACVAPINQPVTDPCELNQNNGKSVFDIFYYRIFFL